VAAAVDFSAHAPLVAALLGVPSVEILGPKRTGPAAPGIEQVSPRAQAALPELSVPNGLPELAAAGHSGSVVIQERTSRTRMSIFRRPETGIAALAICTVGTFFGAFPHADIHQFLGFSSGVFAGSLTAAIGNRFRNRARDDGGS
jgi:hypothetical protein